MKFCDLMKAKFGFVKKVKEKIMSADVKGKFIDHGPSHRDAIAKMTREEANKTQRTDLNGKSELQVLAEKLGAKKADKASK